MYFKMNVKFSLIGYDHFIYTLAFLGIPYGSPRKHTEVFPYWQENIYFILINRPIKFTKETYLVCKKKYHRHQLVIRSRTTLVSLLEYSVGQAGHYESDTTEPLERNR